MTRTVTREIRWPASESEEDDELPGKVIEELQEIVINRNDELAYVLAEGRDLNSLSQARGSHLITTSWFLDWATSSSSARLYVNGNDDDDGDEAVSAMSLACANFVKYVEENETRARVVSFFCGLHVEPPNKYLGIKGLLMSLITQLLYNYPSVTPNIDDEIMAKVSKTNDDDMLWAFLRDVVRKLPEKATVYCIIDGLHFFEKPEWESKMRFIIVEIERLTRDRAFRAAFKILLTSSINCPYISELFPERQRHTLRQSIHPGRYHESLNPDNVEDRIEAYRSARKRQF